MPKRSSRTPQGKGAVDLRRAIKFAVEFGLSDEMAYAMEKTGRIVTTKNAGAISMEHVKEWVAACREYEALTVETQKLWKNRVLVEYPEVEDC